MTDIASQETITVTPKIIDDRRTEVPDSFTLSSPLPPVPKRGPKILPSTNEDGVDVLQIEEPPRPTVPFDWPEEAISLGRRLYLEGYTHFDKLYNPLSYSNLSGHHLGREEVEAMTKPMPSHPTTPSRLPDFSTIFPSDMPHSEALPQAEHAGHTISFVHAGPYSCGPPGYVFGGLLASYADVLMFFACVVGTGHHCVTAALNMQYKAPVPLGKVAVAFSSVTVLSPRKLKANFSLYSLDLKTLYCTADGIFVVPHGWMTEDKIKKAAHADSTQEQQQQIKQQGQDDNSNTQQSTTGDNTLDGGDIISKQA